MSVLDLLARTLTAEAGGEGVPGLLAAGSVIANRVKAGTYGDGFEGVIMRPGQFSAWNGVTGYAGGQGALNMDRIRPTPEAIAVSEAILQGRLADPTGGATHYYNPNAANPAWGANRAGGDWLTIGNHIFGNPDGRPGSSEPRPSAPQSTMSTMNTEAEPMPGLLGRIGQQVTERMPFLQNKDALAQLAIGLQGMTLNPNEGMIASLQQGIEGRRDEDRMNRTAEWLAAQPGGGQFAAAIAAGGNAGQVMQSYFESQQGMSPYEAAQTEHVLAQTDALRNPQPETTAAMQNYEYLVAQGMDPIQAMNKAFGSGGNVTVNNGPDEGAFSEETGKLMAQEAGDLVAAGANAQRNMARIDTLEQALSAGGSGMGAALRGTAANWGLELGEGTSDIQVANALINQLIPEQRPPGSGPMSDRDIEMFRQGLPRLINTPEGNRRIIGAMRGIMEYDAARGQIARDLQLGRITPPEADQKYNQLANPLEGFEVPAQPAAPQAAPQSAPAASQPAAGGSNLPPVPQGVNPDLWPQLWEVMPDEDKALFQ